MFDLKNKDDYSILFGDHEFEFRIEEKPTDKSLEKIMTEEYLSVVTPYL